MLKKGISIILISLLMFTGVTPLGTAYAFLKSNETDYIDGHDEQNSSSALDSSNSFNTPQFTSETQLTDNSAYDWYASFSPDGNKIVFVSSRDGDYEIFVMNADGSSQTQLTNNTTWEYYPSFSPNGSKIVFSSISDGDHEIFSMNVDGSDQTQLTDNAANDYLPSFSPNGSKIVFSSSRDGDYEIFSMNVDGSDQTQLTDNAANDYLARFSPDGNKIVFDSDRDVDFEIFLMNADGSGQTQLTNNTTFDYGPSFSPNGSKIVFSSSRDGDYEIFSMNVDGSDQTQLTDNTAYDRFPSFSPDGTNIVFDSYRDGDFEIFIGELPTQSITAIYSIVRGNNDLLYYNSYYIGSWLGWNSVPGEISDSPAAVVCGGELHLAVRNTNDQIFYGTVTLSTQTFNGWSSIAGVTPSAPDLAADSSCRIYLAVRGTNNRIYLNTLSSGTWGGWQQIPGATVDSPAIVVTGSTLHVSVRDASDKIWYSQVNLTDYSWMGWQPVPGATPSRPDLTAVSQMEVYLAVQGYDNRSYVNRWNGYSWQGWIRPPTGGSPDAPSITVADSKINLMVRDWGGRLWFCDQDLTTSTWSSWSTLTGATPSPPTIAS